MTQDQFLHILYYLNFTDNDKEVDKKDNHYDRLWKVREIFYILSVAYSKFYNPSEHMVIDEVIVLFEGKVAFKQYIPQKHTYFKTKFTSSVTLMATCDTVVYFGKDRKWATTDITASHAIVKELTQSVKGLGS